MISDIYANCFSKGILQKFNNKLLSYALKAKGYNNFRNNYVSGESFFIQNVLAPQNPKLCIDVGANVGNYTRELLEKTSAKVISFEPLPLAFASLKETVSGYENRSTIVNKGVGSKNETLTIHYDPDALDQASFLEDVKKIDYVSNEQKTDVDVVSLDSFCNENRITEIDFIKIDTEGFEKDVIDGASNVLDDIRPNYIQIEFNWHQLFRNTSLNYFAERLEGFDVYQLTYNGWEKRDPKHPFSNIYMFSNFVFVNVD